MHAAVSVLTSRVVMNDELLLSFFLLGHDMKKVMDHSDEVYKVFFIWAAGAWFGSWWENKSGVGFWMWYGELECGYGAKRCNNTLCCTEPVWRGWNTASARERLPRHSHKQLLRLNPCPIAIPKSSFWSASLCCLQHLLLAQPPWFGIPHPVTSLLMAVFSGLVAFV